jgi:FkbM family methyltransferase
VTGADRIANLVIAGTVAFLIAVAGISISTAWLPARWVVFKVTGRLDARCTLSLARTSRERESARREAIAAAATFITPLSQENGLDRWLTPRGIFWTPPPASDGRGLAAALVTRDSRWKHIDGTDLVTVHAGDVVIDGGAHVGTSTAYALAQGARLVVAVEPDPTNVRALELNHAAAIRDGRVTVVPYGLYDREGRLRFTRGSASWDGGFGDPYHHGPDEEELVLPVTTIDALVSTLSLDRVDVIKLDIEGSEIPALRGADQTITRLKPRLSVGTYHLPGDLEGVARTVRELRDDYVITPSRCLEHDGRLFPNLLYFH